MNFTYPEKKLILNDNYFEILRIVEDYYEIRSINTGHCWIIKKTQPGKLITLYHKHKLEDPYYHKHRSTNTVAAAVAQIKSHDDYVLGYSSAE